MTCSCVDMTTLEYDGNANARSYLSTARCAECIRDKNLQSLDAVPETMTIEEFLQSRHDPRFYSIWKLYMFPCSYDEYVVRQRKWALASGEDCSCEYSAWYVYDGTVNARSFLSTARCANCVRIRNLPSLDVVPETMTIDEFLQSRHDPRFYTIWKLYCLLHV